MTIGARRSLRRCRVSSASAPAKDGPAIKEGVDSARRRTTPAEPAAADPPDRRPIDRDDEGEARGPDPSGEPFPVFVGWVKPTGCRGRASVGFTHPTGSGVSCSGTPGSPARVSPSPRFSPNEPLSMRSRREWHCGDSNRSGLLSSSGRTMSRQPSNRWSSSNLPGRSDTSRNRPVSFCPLGPGPRVGYGRGNEAGARARCAAGPSGPRPPRRPRRSPGRRSRGRTPGRRGPGGPGRGCSGCGPGSSDPSPSARPDEDRRSRRHGGRTCNGGCRD